MSANENKYLCIAAFTQLSYSILFITLGLADTFN